MRPTFRLLVFGCVLACATTAAAQNKFVGKCSQGKPDPNYVVSVGDRPNHNMILGKATPVVCVASIGLSLLWSQLP